MLKGTEAINVDTAGIEDECSGFHGGNVFQDLPHFIQGEMSWQGNTAGPQFMIKAGGARVKDGSAGADVNVYRGNSIGQCYQEAIVRDDKGIDTGIDCPFNVLFTRGSCSRV